MELNERIQFSEKMKNGLRQFVLDINRLSKSIPYSQEAKILKDQLSQCSGSVYSNYRAANRARSKADFFSKLSIVLEEADETEMWLDLLILSGRSNNEETHRLHSESLEILKITTTARKNTY